MLEVVMLSEQSYTNFHRTMKHIPNSCTLSDKSPSNVIKSISETSPTSAIERPSRSYIIHKKASDCSNFCRNGTHVTYVQ